MISTLVVIKTRKTFAILIPPWAGYRPFIRQIPLASFPLFLSSHVPIQAASICPVRLYPKSFLMKQNSRFGLAWFCKESTKKFDLSWLISKVSAYWFSLISITMSKKWVILFTMHNFVLNVTKNCYELVIQLYRR